ncbi:MAG: TlpA family protein disulfide reductase [Chloroflexota bacterium]|nr:TlpA family protein disulfide reductase [Chloroflexota bacterium]
MARLQVRRSLALLLGAAAAVGTVAIAWATLFQPPPASSAGARPGAPAPPITLPVLGGGMSDLSTDRGKVVLVNFWATWCEPCKSEMPALQQLSDELRDRPFRLYSIDLQEDTEAVQAFLRQYDLRLYVLLDEDGSVTRAYGVRGLPATFLIDRAGIVRNQRLGPLLAGDSATQWSEAWLAEQVRSLLPT